MSQSEQQRKANVRLALILATIAIVLGVGFVLKVALLGVR
jgi:predicted nucleic acid-binding Zn ribbon protein